MKTLLHPPTEMAAPQQGKAATPQTNQSQPKVSSQNAKSKPFVLTEDHPLVDRIGSRRKEREACRLLAILDGLEGGAK